MVEVFIYLTNVIDFTHKIKIFGVRKNRIPNLFRFLIFRIYDWSVSDLKFYTK